MTTPESELFVDLLHVLGFGEAFLRDLDLSTLELVNTSFVSGRHVRRESDLVWKLTVAESPVYFYLLIEFQSGVDETMPLRFLRYLTEFYESLVVQLDRTETLPAVFYVENTAPEDGPETIDVLIDILKEEVPEVSERFTEWFASYLAGQGLDVTADQPIRDLQEVRAMFAPKFQEYSRRLKEEALDEGRAAERLAIARRLLERGETVEEVAELTGLSPDDVADLAKER